MSEPLLAPGGGRRVPVRRRLGPVIFSHPSMTKPKPAAPPAQVVAPTAAPTGGVKKVSLAGFAKKSATTGKVYPVLPDPDGQVSEIVELVLTQADELDALTASLDYKAEPARAGQFVLQ